MDEELELQLLEHSVKLRGILLEATIEIERKMDRFLSNYFCKDEITSNELLEFLWMSERVTLGSKKDILFYVLDAHYKDFLKAFPEFKSSLEDLVPHRNIFAHLEIDRDLSDYNGVYEIKFKKFSKGKLEVKKYGRSQIEQITEGFNRVNFAFDLLLNNNAP